METFPREDRLLRDARTGVQVRQITSHPSNHHAPFFLSPAYDDAMRWLTFLAYRTGRPEIFVEDRSDGRLLRITEQDDLHPWSIHPSHDGRFVYFTAGTTARRVTIETGVVEDLWTFPGAQARGAGMVAAGMGTTALSRCDRYWALKLARDGATDLVIIDTTNGEVRDILRRDTVAHLQFRPDDGTMLYYAGNFKERLWTVRVDGSDHRSHYERRPGEWITHESWLPGTSELLFVDWPHRVRAIDVDTGVVRDVVHGNAWHPAANRDGTRIVADTNAPDVGLVTFPADGTGSMTPLCTSDASSEGRHWWGPFPYEDGPIHVQAAQHTHPHPTFAPDGRHVLFASDRTGTSQLYEVDV